MSEGTRVPWRPKVSDDKFPEFASARDEDDECVVCGASGDEFHDLWMHDWHDTGEDAAWD